MKESLRVQSSDPFCKTATRKVKRSVANWWISKTNSTTKDIPKKHLPCPPSANCLKTRETE